VFQKVPVEIQGNTVLSMKIKHLAGEHMVGIRCSLETWNKLTNYQNEISVQIKSADNPPAQVFAIEPGRQGTTCDSANCHYFFAISAKGDVVLEISFRQMPIKASAEIIVCKTPEQTESPW